MESIFMPDLRFYTTAGCHLCDQAFAALEPIARRKRLVIECIDVMDDPDAEAAFAESIPVIMNEQRAEPLCWPFTREDIYRWLM